MRPQEIERKAKQVALRVGQQARDELSQAVVSHLGNGGEIEEAAVSRRLPMPVLPRKAAVGDSVKLKSLGRIGIIRSKVGDSVEVEVGLLRTRVSLDDIDEVIPMPTGISTQRAATVRVQTAPVTHGSLSEINVIGETADEARRRVDKFLDNAYLASLRRVRVIHGSGKGILRRSLAEMFAEHPHVEKFAAAPQEEGGAGATIVELKT
jgi:DNA mismatch repair protein MutS2